METWLVTGSRGFLGTNAGAYLRGRVNLVGQARVGAESKLYERIVGLDLRNPDEMVDLIASSRAFEANIAVVKNARQLAQQAMSIGKR